MARRIIDIFISVFIVMVVIVLIKKAGTKWNIPIVSNVVEEY